MNPSFLVRFWSWYKALGLLYAAMLLCFWAAWHGSGQVEPQCTWQNVIIV